MLTKFSKPDRLFSAALLTGLLLHIVLSFSFPDLHDESFYVTIPFRLLQGDSLFRQEWHLSQMSSLFTFLPVWGWIKVTGSADGLLFFLRYIYIAVYTGIALIAYLSFRKYGNWAVAAVFLFYTQTPYRILSLNYNSVYAAGTLLLALCLLALSGRTSPRISLAAGLCAGCCCVCNPLFAGVYILYLCICSFCVLRKRNSKNFLFCRETMVFSLIGVSTIAILMIAFFFLTGGTVQSLFDNLPLILKSSEYSLTSGTAFLEKIKITWTAFSNINLGMPFLLPLMYLVMLMDPKKHTASRRCLYLSLALIAGVICIAGIIRSVAPTILFQHSMFFSLPLFILTTTSYILTKSRNTRLFSFVWIPCVIAACVQYIAANTTLTALGFMLAAANVAGVLFARDLYREMAEASAQDSSEEPAAKEAHRFGRRLICAGLCLQILFHFIVCIVDQVLPLHTIRLNTGPYAGMYATELQAPYNEAIDDLDYIRATTPDDAPLLIVSYYNWMYLYADRPFSVYTTWFDGYLQTGALLSYYQQNPDKIPQYIYVDSASHGISSKIWDALSEMFAFTTDELSRGFLLTVEGRKF